MKQGNKQSSDKNSHVQQKRGPELGKKMADSQKEGEQFRAGHQGADERKSPGSAQPAHSGKNAQVKK